MVSPRRKTSVLLWMAAVAVAFTPVVASGITGSSLRRSNNNNNNNNKSKGRWSKSKNHRDEYSQHDSSQHDDSQHDDSQHDSSHPHPHLRNNSNSNGNGNSNSNGNSNGNGNRNPRRFLESLTGSTTARESCEAARLREEADVAPSGGASTCTCSESKLDERYSEFLDPSRQPVVYKLECVDRRCSYCSPDGGTCDRFSYGALFEEVRYRDGATNQIRDGVGQVGYFETNQYIVGRSESVVYTEYNDPSNDGRHACSMEIDGLECALCEYIECGSNNSNGNDNGNSNTNTNGNTNTNTNTNTNDVFYGLNVVCSNIMIGDNNGGFVAARDFQTCDPDQLDVIGGSQGVFEMYDPDYGRCFTSAEGCDRDKAELEQSDLYDCECLDDHLPTDGTSPFLQNVELVCRIDGTGTTDGAIAIAINDNDNEAYTDTTREVCATVQSDTITRTYSSYVAETQSRSIRHGNGAVIAIVESDCLTTKGEADRCKTCTATLNDRQCQSCAMAAVCGGTSSTTAATVDCSNLDPEGLPKPVDLCRSESVDGTPFEPFAVCGFGTRKIPGVFSGPTAQAQGQAQAQAPPTEAPTRARVDMLVGGGGNHNNNHNHNVQVTDEDLSPPGPVSLLACREKRLALLNRGNYIDTKIMVCDCFRIDEQNTDTDSGTLLSCTTEGGDCGTTNGGSVCNAEYGNTNNSNSNNDGNNDDHGTCFREELVQGFLPDGSTSPLTRTTTYTHGSALGNSLVGRTLALTEYGGGDCDLSVDGVTCRSCQLRTCSGVIGERPLADCSNIIDHPSFYLDACQKFPSYGEGLLLRLAAGSNTESGDAKSQKNNFNVCSNEFLAVDSNNGGNNNNSNGNSNSNNGDGDGNSAPAPVAVDPSLPTTCPNAQPIVLPNHEPQKVARNSDNFSMVSFVSSTSGLAPLGVPIDSCSKSPSEGSDSPGLWYSLVGNGRGIRASVCRTPTDFEARISVYKGPPVLSESRDDACRDLSSSSSSCVAGSFAAADDGGSPCDTHWVAETGITYYVRVHGGSSSQTGSFHLFVEALTDDATELCGNTNGANQHQNQNEFDASCLACSDEKASKIGERDNPSDLDCQCIQNPSTGGYHLTCVDVSCLKCNPRQDVCGFDTFELDVKGRDASAAGSYESFYFLTNHHAGKGDIAASEIVSIKSTACLEIGDPYQKCTAARDELMNAEDSKVFCECRGTSEEGGYMLLCSMDDSYQYCASGGDGNGNGNTCATVLFGQTISRYGAVTSDFRNYSFQTGDSDSDSEQTIGVDRDDSRCTATMNNQQCTKCQIVECETNGNTRSDALQISASNPSNDRRFGDLSIDCSNVVPEGQAATFDCGSVGTDERGDNWLSILAGEASPSVETGSDPEAAPAATPTRQTLPPFALPPTLPPVTAPIENKSDDDDDDDSTPAVPPVYANDKEVVTITIDEGEDANANTNANTNMNIDATTTESNEISEAWGLWRRRSLRQTTIYYLAPTVVLVAALLL